jgi:F420-non-reducing hydrogenase iron-sulfur subunit
MTIKRMRFLQDLLKFTGYEEGRLHLEWISAAEGPKLAETVRNFTEKIKKMGPSPLKRAALAA